MDAPRPHAYKESLEAWCAIEDGRLAVQRCGECGHYQYYPRTMCVKCHSEHVAFEMRSGEGTVTSYSTIYRAAVSAFEQRVPYIVALIRLREVPVTLLSNVLLSGDQNTDLVHIGSAVVVQRYVLDDKTSVIHSFVLANAEQGVPSRG